MNKQELIEKIENLPDNIGLIRPHVDKREVISLVKQLDEPEKVKVPPFVAVWIEEKRDMGWKLTKMVLQANLNEQYWRWVVDNQETFARAWLDGYEVEKEKRYLVKVKGMSEENTYLTFRFGHTWMLSNFEECEEFRLHHTRKELEEAGFGWVFDCPGIEIEEVEE